MPKIVDHEKRKQHIAEAAWRVILERGMQGASVRNIAREAGLSLGALRHYFSSQRELLHFSMKLVQERVETRIGEIAGSALPPRERALRVLLELVPVDQETWAEMEVWFAFVYHARFEGLENVLKDRLWQGMRRLIRYLHDCRVLRPGLDLEFEAERLYALVDGLALHALLEPERLSRERVTEVLVKHLASICTEERQDAPR